MSVASRTALITAMATVICPAIDFNAHVGTNKPYLDERAGVTGGASVRFPVTRRLSIRPEALAGTIPNYSHTLILASMTFDFTDPANRAVGYVVGGGGGVRTRDSWSQYTNWSATALAGAGVRVRLSDRWITGAEFRIGLNAFPMVTFNLGYRWRTD